MEKETQGGKKESKGNKITVEEAMSKVQSIMSDMCKNIIFKLFFSQGKKWLQSLYSKMPRP